MNTLTYNGYNPKKKYYLEPEKKLDFSAFFCNLEKSYIRKNQYKISSKKPLINFRDKFFSLPIQLKEIINQINDFIEFIDDKENFIDYEGIPNDLTLINGISFIVNYSNAIYEKFDSILQCPYIDCFYSGSMYLKFETSRAKFVIIFNNDDANIAYYYGESIERNIPFKSAIRIEEKIDEILLLWMMQNLTK